MKTKKIYMGHQNETIMIKITKNEIKMKTNNITIKNQ